MRITKLRAQEGKRYVRHISKSGVFGRALVGDRLFCSIRNSDSIFIAGEGRG